MLISGDVVVQAEDVADNAAVIYRQSDIMEQTKAPRRDSMCVNLSLALSGPILDSSLDNVTLRQTWRENQGAICDLKVVVDHTFYENIAHSSKELAVSVVTQHVVQADFIFRSTDLTLDALPDNIGFAISEVQIYESTTNADYWFEDTSLDREQLMNRFCSYNFNQYCLAVAFTFRELGLSSYYY